MDAAEDRGRFGFVDVLIRFGHCEGSPEGRDLARLGRSRERAVAQLNRRRRLGAICVGCRAFDWAEKDDTKHGQRRRDGGTPEPTGQTLPGREAVRYHPMTKELAVVCGRCR